WAISTSTITTTLSNLWKGMGIVGVLILVRDVRAALRAVCSVDPTVSVVISVVVPATCSERVCNVHHPVRKSARAVVCLLHGLVGIRECSDEVQGEVLVNFPVGVDVGVDSRVCGCRSCARC